MNGPAQSLSAFDILEPAGWRADGACTAGRLLTEAERAPEDLARDRVVARRVPAASVAAPLDNGRDLQRERRLPDGGTISVTSDLTALTQHSDFSRSRHSDGAETYLQDSVISAVDLVRATMESNVVVRLDLGRPDRRVPLGPTEVQQIVMNLILNAVQAIGKRPGTIIVQMAAVEGNDPRFRAALGYNPTCSYIRLSVIDDGPGIPVEILPRIFEPFFTTRDFGRGAGLGLAVVHSLVTQAGGWVDVIGSSGARFDVLLPILDDLRKER